MAKRIVLECSADEALMMALGITRKEIQHQPNKGAVCNYQQKQSTPLAIVDEDPSAGQPKHLLNYFAVGERYGIRLLKHRNSDQRIVVIKPMLEIWIIERCIDVGIDPAKYGLPVKGEELHNVVNRRIEKFKELLLPCETPMSPD